MADTPDKKHFSKKEEFYAPEKVEIYTTPEKETVIPEKEETHSTSEKVEPTPEVYTYEGYTPDTPAYTTPEKVVAPDTTPEKISTPETPEKVSEKVVAPETPEKFSASKKVSAPAKTGGTFMMSAPTKLSDLVIGDAKGFPAQYGQHIQNNWANNQGDKIIVKPATGSTLVAVVFGLDGFNPFDLLHGKSPNPAWFAGINDFNAPPTISDNARPPTVAIITNVGIVKTVSTLTAVDAHDVDGNTTYTGTGLSFTPGCLVTITGLADAVNNGTFLCVSSSGLTAVLANSAGIAATSQTGTATSNVLTVAATGNNFLAGDSVTLTGLTTATYLNNQTVTIVGTGASFTANDPTKHDTVTSASDTGKATGSGGGNNWVLSNAKVVMGGLDYTPPFLVLTAAGAASLGTTVYTGTITGGISNALKGNYFTVAGFTNAVNNGHFLCTASDATTLTLTNSVGVIENLTLPTTAAAYNNTNNYAANSSKWSLDSAYPNVYIFYATNVIGDGKTEYTININSCYQNGIDRPGDLAAGKPIFDQGIDVHVLEFKGALAVSQANGALSAANPATGGLYTTSGTGTGLILTAGLMESGNAFSTYTPVDTVAPHNPLATGTTMLASGKCVASQAHWGIQIQFQTAAGAITPGFANPLGYEMAVASIALF